MNQLSGFTWVAVVPFDAIFGRIWVYNAPSLIDYQEKFTDTKGLRCPEAPIKRLFGFGLRRHGGRLLFCRRVARISKGPVDFQLWVGYQEK